MDTVEAKTLEAKFFNIDVELISRELVAECVTKKIECHNYWDSHGKKLPEATTQHNFDNPKKVELYKECLRYNYKYLPAQTYEFFKLYVNGDQLDVGEIMEYRELKTKVKLTCCTGAG